MERQADAAGIDVLHAIPGRARVRIDALKRNPALARRLGERLTRLPGMRRVETNTVTGTVLLVYDSGDMRWLEELPEAAGEAIDLRSVRPRLEAPLRQQRSGGPPAERVSAYFASLNARVGAATGGFDLAVLVPGVLMLLGVRAFATEGARLPTWYDFLWFGFGTFVMLNARAEPRSARAE